MTRWCAFYVLLSVFQESDPAYIEKVSPPSPHESWIAQNVTFVCKANGVPTPTITWKRPNGTEIKRVVGSENVLRLLIQKDGDFGSYLCEADNTMGSVDNHTVQVYQIRPPDAPTITTQDKDIQVESLWVKWTPPILNGGSNITGYRVTVLQDGKVIINKTITPDKLEYFVDKGLTKSTYYTLRVSALNKVNEGMADEKNVMTKYQGAPGTAEIIGLPAVTKSKEVPIKWNVPQNNGASITLYTVYQRNVKKGDIKGEWIKIRVIKDLSRRQVVVSLEGNKVYEFVVTANNSFGESLREGQNIRKLNVLGDIPEPVNIQVEGKDDTVILRWAEPENNGATIIRYSIYTRIVGDEEWKKVADLKVKDAFKLKYTLVLEKGKNYELMVTATNAFGESAMNEDNIQTVEVPNLATPFFSLATPRPVECQKGSCAILHVFYILFIVVLVIVIIALSVVIWKIRRRPCRRRGDLSSMNPVSLQLKDNMGLPSELDTKEAATYATPAAGGGYYMPLHPSGRSWEVSREDVHVNKVIGKGAFSQVVQATVKNIRANQEDTTVAVKMLKANAPPSDRKDLLSELELMKKLKPHPHVIKLIGCVTESEPLMVLVEYVTFGDLLGYLRKSRGLNDTYYKNPDVKPETNLTSEQLMKFAWEVADGMCYLSSKKIVHRDLAARNVLVGEGERCKVTDFGMARNVEQDDIYTKKSRGRLPVKWTAYEALFYGVYTTQSDVWSYGVLLYEILTIGGSPYPDTHARLIADKIQQGYRMPKPGHVDSNLYEIMMKCWEEDPNDRPTFEKLRKTMKDMERNHKIYVNLSQYDTRLYANVSDLKAE
ncbi:angiopoietin-1 receptor-like isoform X2 [Montipora foliosa]|uniref:angiopoietin-1 receptor-like isoform X2 n=1 Tax=Montipora foliosa TaxID=591990 RepID=UPI0035F14ADE